jgi:hypothetical protein
MRSAFRRIADIAGSIVAWLLFVIVLAVQLILGLGSCIGSALVSLVGLYIAYLIVMKIFGN